jgi:uncharacterized protein
MAVLDPDPVTADMAERLATYRGVREQIERAILPLATSVDGRTFTCQASLHHLRLSRGGYVILEAEGHRRLGMVTDLWADSDSAAGEGLTGAGAGILVRLARGTGVVLEGEGPSFHDASMRPAEPEEVGRWFDRTRLSRGGLSIGDVLLAPGVGVTLDSRGLNRHTFVCGQSGSGKTHSLGVLLERVLLETSLRVVILDPNSDYVGLAHVRDDADPRLAERYARVKDEVSVWGDDSSADHPLRLAFHHLQPSVRAAILGLDPVADREEYAVLTDLVRSQEGGRPLITRVDQLLEAETPGARRLGIRADNLGVLRWRVWSPTLPSLVEELRRPTARCTVVDIGSLDTAAEQRLVAEAVLSTLWESRLSRRPCLIVIDEAHNVCPGAPVDALTRLCTRTAVQIAAEGRKYGLFLLTSTQRPHKVHENVVSQCDNLLLMRMNSQADVAELGRLLSFVPPGLMAGATSLRLGQALVAGRLLPQAAYVRMGERASREGGADIAPTWVTSPASD